MANETTITKVLPFETKNGIVKGHEIARFNHEWLRGKIESVVFWDFNEEAQLPIEIVVHWTRWTIYAKRMWPKGGEIKAVLLGDGTRAHATSIYCGHTDKSYEEAPLICRDEFKIVTLQNREKLLEVVGVDGWLRSNRDEEETEKFLACPWERDNKKYDEIRKESK